MIADLLDRLKGDTLSRTEAETLLAYCAKLKKERDHARETLMLATGTLNNISTGVDGIMRERDNLAMALIVALIDRGRPLAITRDALDPKAKPTHRLLWGNDIARDQYLIAVEPAR